MSSMTAAESREAHLRAGERLATLEEQVARAKEEQTDTEIRLRRIERNMYIGIGALTFLEVVLKFSH